MERMPKFFLMMTFAFILTAESMAAPTDETAKKPFPQFNLLNRTQGESAIKALGAKLPEVAAWYGMSTSEFAKLLRTDRSAWLDKQARLYYIDDFPEPADSEPQGPAEAAPFPLEDTFTLNSRPGSNRVIYLDFDGHTTTGTAWNNSYDVDPIVSPPYSKDGDSSIFSTTELEYIQNMWRQVAEDFAPFDVNVTTQDPGQNAIIRTNSTDQVYGTRVVITQDNFAGCGCGGFAYVGVYDYSGGNYKPAFVFNTGQVGAGEAISHETGHNLGLNHDGVAGGTSYYQGHGSGATGWAPIMGVGYYKKLVQWSKGEYTGANRPEDDIVVIQNNGAPLMADDHGDAEVGATVLGSVSDGTNVTITGNGLVSHRSDIDVFSFVSAGGNYAINIAPAIFSPNLDIFAELYNSSGDLIASSNPVDGLSAALNGSFTTGGEYFLKIDGVGKGDPLGIGYTDYGSLGQYTIDGLVPDAGGLQTPQAVASVSYTPDYAPLFAQFDATASTDLDGNIISYAWDYGDGNSGVGVTASNIYTAPGNYTATLTVTDNDGLSSNDSVSISVTNHSPVAVAGVDIIEGTAALTVAFNGSSSSDQDGTVVSHLWDFKDGNTSTAANPSHTYTSASDYSALLTVTDNLGANHSVTAPMVSVAPPLFVDQLAVSETFVAGTATGSYNNTFADDNFVESIRERESGGRKTSRYSYLEHVWNFNVQSGYAVTLFLNAWQTNSSDGDQMEFSYSVNGAPYQALEFVINTSDNGVDMISLPSGTNGQVKVRVKDSDRTASHKSLDTVYVDVLYIRTENQQGGMPPNAPSLLGASATSSSQINLNWNDGSNDEYGVTVERFDTVTSSWVTVATTGANVTSYQDSGLASQTNYLYRVAAYNGAGSSAYSNQAAATTDAGSPITLSVSGYKVKGIQHADLSWTDSTSVDIYRNGALITTISGSFYTDNIGIKGAGSYIYQVCDHDNTQNCSNDVTILF